MGTVSKTTLPVKITQFNDNDASVSAVVASSGWGRGTNAAYKFERSVFETGLIGCSNPSPARSVAGFLRHPPPLALFLKIPLFLQLPLSVSFWDETREHKGQKPFRTLSFIVGVARSRSPRLSTVSSSTMVIPELWPGS